MTIEELIEELENNKADVIIVSKDEKEIIKAIKKGALMILWSTEKVQIIPGYV